MPEVDIRRCRTHPAGTSPQIRVPRASPLTSQRGGVPPRGERGARPLCHSPSTPLRSLRPFGRPQGAERQAREPPWGKVPRAAHTQGVTEGVARRGEPSAIASGSAPRGAHVWVGSLGEGSGAGWRPSKSYRSRRLQPAVLLRRPALANIGLTPEASSVVPGFSPGPVLAVPMREQPRRPHAAGRSARLACGGGGSRCRLKPATTAALCARAHGSTGGSLASDASPPRIALRIALRIPEGIPEGRRASPSPLRVRLKRVKSVR